MIEALKGNVLWAVVLIVLGVLGAATYLASQGILSGSDWLVLGTAVLASVGIVSGAHVASQAAINAINTPAPGSGGTTSGVSPPGPEPQAVTPPVPVPAPANAGPVI